MPYRPEVFQFVIFCLEPVRVYVHQMGLRAFATLFTSCLSIRLFCYDLSVPIFCSRIFLLLSHPVVDMVSPILPLIVGRISFVVLKRPVLSISFGLVSVSFLVFLLSLVFLIGFLKLFFFSSSRRAISVSSEYF